MIPMTHDNPPPFSCRAILLACLLLCGAAAGGEAAPSIAFLDVEKARAAIADDPPYFEQLQPMEMATKTGSPLPGKTLFEQRAEFKRRYQAAVLAFTDAEKDALKTLVRRLDPVLREHYPLLGRMAWSFLKVDDTIEGKLPHTRASHIVLPQWVCTRMAKAVTPADPDIGGAFDLLVHEQLHVLQRARPELFDSLYIKQWGFVKAEFITECPWLTERRLTNPDGVDCRWIFPLHEKKGIRFIWPLIVLGDGPALRVMPQDARMLAVSVVEERGGFRVQQEEDGRPVMQALVDIRPYRALFPPTTNIFHPNEASASLFAMLVVVDHFTPKALPEARKARLEAAVLGPLRTWARRNLANEPIESNPAAVGDSKSKPDADTPASPTKRDF